MYVTVERYADLARCDPALPAAYIARRLWSEGREFHRAPDGDLLVCTVAAPRSLKALPERRQVRRPLTCEPVSGVYFISGDSEGPVKIGYSIDVADRICTLQTSHWNPLQLLAVASGSRDLEARYHKRFASTRLMGEWFARSPALMAEIESLATPC